MSINYDRNNRRTSIYSVSSDGDEENSIKPGTIVDFEKGRYRVRDSADGQPLKSISQQDRRQHKFYKPTSNRTPILVLFLGALGLCILLLELSVATHANANDVHALNNTSVARSLNNRAEVAAQAGSRVSVEWLPQVTEFANSNGMYETLHVPSRRQEASAPLVTSATSSGLNTAEDLEDNAEELTVYIPTETPGEPYNGGQLTITNDGDVTGAPNPADQVTVTSSKIEPQSSPNSVNQVSLTSQILAGESKSGEKAASITPQVTQTTDSSPGSTMSPGNAATIDGSDIVPISSDTTLFSGTSIVAIFHSGDSFSSTAVMLTDSEGKPTATISYLDAQTSSYQASGPSNTDVTTSDQFSSTNTSRSRAFNQFDYFVAMYIPNIIGVILQATWLVVFATFKMMEPFYQLAQKGGAASSATLTADYLSLGLSLSFGRATSDGHWIMVMAGLVQLGLAIIVTLVSEAMNVVPTAYCKTELSNNQPCNPEWVVNLTVIRAMEVLLVGCFSLVLMIIVLNRRRVSGVWSDPSRISTMADILVHKPLINEMRDIPAHATKTQIEHDLQQSRYMLGTFVSEGREQYGIIKLEDDVQSLPFAKEPFYKSAYRRADMYFEALTDHVTDSLPYLPDVICMTLLIILFMIILVYKLTPGDDTGAFNSWMNTGHMGPSMLLSAFGVMVGFLIKRKERLHRLSHPYVLLSKGPQRASETITAGLRATQYTALVKGLAHGNISLALLALAAISSDIALILIPGIPWTAAQTRPVYLASTYVVLILLGVMFLAQARITFKDWQRGHIECPETLAAGLMRLCASRFVEENNVQTEWNKEWGSDMSQPSQDNEQRQRDRYEGPQGERRYRFGCFEGVDGVQRWMVEEDKWVGKTH